MAETPEQLYERARDALRMPPVVEWDTFPFDGDLRPRPLDPPAAAEEPREGEGGGDGCGSCTAPDDDYLWTSANWRLSTLGKPSGLPVIVLVESREHYDAPGDLPPELAAEQGVMIGAVERAVASVEHVERVHVGRWGDGSAHLHWWFIARPSRVLQLRGSFAAIWDDILPPTPEDVWNANVAQVVAHLESDPAAQTLR